MSTGLDIENLKEQIVKYGVIGKDDYYYYPMVPGYYLVLSDDEEIAILDSCGVYHWITDFLKGEMNND